jgi:hypothetical protein
VKRSLGERKPLLLHRKERHDDHFRARQHGEKRTFRRVQAADLADTIGWSLTVPVEQQGAMWRFILLVRALG